MTSTHSPLERLGRRLNTEEAAVLQVRGEAIARSQAEIKDASTPTQHLASKVYELYDTVDRINSLTPQQKRRNLGSLVLSKAIGRPRRYYSVTKWYDSISGGPTRLLDMAGPEIDARELRLPTQEVATIHGLITCGFVVELPAEATRGRLGCNIYDEARVSDTETCERDLVYIVDCSGIQPDVRGYHPCDSTVEVYKDGEKVDPLLVNTDEAALQALGLLDQAVSQVRSSVPSHFVV